jgi:crossover junction endodeoxyribonuclease RusA
MSMVLSGDLLDQEPPALQFFCPGHPVPQGSKTAVPTGKGYRVKENLEKTLKPWRQAIATYAKAEANGLKFQGACSLQACFWFKRPTNHFGTGRNAGKLKASAPAYREQNPDLDKLLRALCDGLVMSGVLRDDSLIVKIEAEKRYGDPGVLVRLASV